MSHTLGPWSSCGCGRCGLVWSKDADYCVADVSGGENDEQGSLSRPQREANIRLIAAAPTMKDVLADFLDAFDVDDLANYTGEQTDAILRARALLAEIES